MMIFRRVIFCVAVLCFMRIAVLPATADVGVGAEPIEGAEMFIDGSREMLDKKWIYWEGPGFKSAMPIK